MLVFKLTKISILATAAVALALAHAASAATFDGVGSHTLTSANLGLNTNLGGGFGETCTDSSFTVNVPAGGATATVTAASFTHCTGTGTVAGLTIHMTATGFPWEITRIVAGGFVVDGVHVTQNFTGAGHVTLEGNLVGTINNATHVVTFANSTGLTATSATLGTSPATVSGTFTDNLNTLAIT